MRDDSAKENARFAEEAKRTAHEQAQDEQEQARAQFVTPSVGLSRSREP